MMPTTSDNSEVYDTEVYHANLWLFRSLFCPPLTISRFMMPTFDYGGFIMSIYEYTEVYDALLWVFRGLRWPPLTISRFMMPTSDYSEVHDAHLWLFRSLWRPLWLCEVYDVHLRLFQSLWCPPLIIPRFLARGIQEISSASICYRLSESSALATSPFLSKWLSAHCKV